MSFWNYVFMYMFAIEVFIRFVAHGRQFWGDKWMVFDLVILTITLGSEALVVFSGKIIKKSSEEKVKKT